jgi:hypothetical protein
VAFDLDDTGGVVLKFEGTKYDGLEVMLRQTSVGGLLDLAMVADRLDDLKGGESSAGPEQAAAHGAGAARRAAGVVEPHQGGEPVPADLDGLLRLPPDLLGRVLNAYIQAQSQADPNLPSASSGTPTADPPEATIPMANPGS